MSKKNTGLAALAFGIAMALTPTTAAAKDHDDYRRGYSFDRHYEKRERHERREHERREHERWEHERRERGRSGLSFGFSFGGPARRYYAPVPAPADGYYDQLGYYHSYGPSGYYDRFGYWHEY